VNADVGAVIQAISKISGRNFVVDPRVKGTLNIVTARPVPRNLSYSILLSALRLQGYAAIEGQASPRSFPRPTPSSTPCRWARARAPAAATASPPRCSTCKHESASQLVPVIRPLVSPNNTVTAYPGNNSLVVTDYAENIGRIAQIIESIDVPQGDMRVINLKHASALDLAQTVNRLLNDAGSGSVGGTPGVGGDASQRVSVIGDPRTNSLLVRSENPSKLNAVRQLVANLDQPGAAGNIHVVYLKNAEATKVAQTLRAVLSGEAGNSGQGSTGGSTSGSSFAPSSTGTSSGTSTGSGSNVGNTPSFGTSSKATQAPPAMASSRPTP
jgi:general secretion pathway protein D